MRYTFIFIFFLIGTVSSGQVLNGVLKDANSYPIEGAYIINIDKEVHTHSNAQGYFALKDVAEGDSIKITHIGYEEQTFTAKNLDQNLVIVLKDLILSLDAISVLPKLDALSLFAEIDIQLNPVNSSQEVLRQVPGLIIGQHAGGGKAEQIFLRGFDIDHGTDINISLDGLPVNMVSNAHGQGYADLHFIIPETIDKVKFGKGPYFADKGNFTTAGFVDFKMLERLDRSTIKTEIGQFSTQRFMGMFNLTNESENSAYIASEFLSSDGPFDSPQNFTRANLIGKYTHFSEAGNKIGLTLSHFTSKWDASGQIPQRAVNSGRITRFGSIDDTEGGYTSRSNIMVTHYKNLNPNSYIKNYAYLSAYDFDLFSNFTFFLNDSINGDQIRQKESRKIFGFSSQYHKTFKLKDYDGQFSAGLCLRNDMIDDIELSHTFERSTLLSNIKLGDIIETNISGFTEASFEFGRLIINPSFRLDHFNFQYNDDLAPAYQTIAQTELIASPKLNFMYNYSTGLQLYLKTGKGFHSNDTRVVLANSGHEVLPAAYGSDLGFIWKPLPEMLINTAVWLLFLEQEFVYVGDEGVVEPSGKTFRSGIELNIRHQPVSWLLWNIDANYTFARFLDEPSGKNYIPLAPDMVLVGGLNILHPSGIFGGSNFRYIRNRPANEDFSIIAEGYSIIDINAGYQYKDFQFEIMIQNLLNSDWNETQFATLTRLQNEPLPVEEIHFIPGFPFFIKLIISYDL